jgi:tetratricopeptide (TPR) repeat protein
MLDEAIQMMQRAIHLAPDPTAYQRTLATLYERHGEPGKAVQLYQLIAARRADDPDAFYKLGTYAQAQGQLTRAVAYYRRAVHLNPHHLPFQMALKLALQ